MNCRLPRDKTTPDQARPTVIRWADMTWKDHVRIGLGVAAFILGVLGLVLPILQGVLFLIVSALLLAPYSRWVQKWLARFEARFPKVAEKAHSMARRCSRRSKTDG